MSKAPAAAGPRVWPGSWLSAADRKRLGQLALAGRSYASEAFESRVDPGCGARLQSIDV